MQYRHLPAGIKLDETGRLNVVLRGGGTPPLLYFRRIELEMNSCSIKAKTTN